MTDWFPLVLYILAAVLAAVLIWAFVELALTIRRARATVKDLDPVIEKVNSIAASLEPSSKRIDPLLERVSLTVDAVNLEIMRADQILSDVSDVTGTLSGTITKVTDITDAPLNLLSGAAEKMRDIFSGKKPAKSPAAGLAAESSDIQDGCQSDEAVSPGTNPSSAGQGADTGIANDDRPPIQKDSVRERAKKEAAGSTRKISGSGYFNYPQTTATVAGDTGSTGESRTAADSRLSEKADLVDFNPDIS